jgi:predicted dehydrogenase
MIAETKPDVVVATGPDGTHCEHIVGGLRGGCEVISEKPMVIDCAQARQVFAAERASGHKVTVAFNMRYLPTHKRLKRLIQSGKLGRITNVEFIYNLHTWHGSSYFYRWNRDRAQSGGLSLSKSTHHFDMVNWLLDDRPEEVFAYGALNYYGPNGALRPRDAQGQPLNPVEEKKRCPIFQKHYAGKCAPDDNDIRTGWDRFNLPQTAQYPADQRRYIYDKEINIEDTYSVVVRYQRGTSLCYSINFCTPWEGYHLNLNGTAGRAELTHFWDTDPQPGPEPSQFITYHPLFGGKEVIEIPPVAGGHGGADLVIRRDLIDGPCDESRELRLVAGSEEGALSVAVGEGVWRSVRDKKPISIPKLLDGSL